jgi:Na+:H+ antiporter, NhaC family
MAGVLTTVWLVMAAMAFAAILEHAAFLERLLQPIVTRARSRGQLILADNASGIGLNVTAGDQHVADVLPARMYRDEFRRRGLAPQVLSRAVEGSPTGSSWSSAGPLSRPRRRPRRSPRRHPLPPHQPTAPQG